MPNWNTNEAICQKLSGRQMRNDLRLYLFGVKYFMLPCEVCLSIVPHPSSPVVSSAVRRR